MVLSLMLIGLAITLDPLPLTAFMVVLPSKRGPLPDAAGGMPLLDRHVPVRQQPGIDRLRMRIDRRPRPPRIGLARRRDRAGQRLPHRPPVRIMLLRQFPDRQPAGLS